MFKKHATHDQLGLFDWDQELSPRQAKMLPASLEARFYADIFCKIDESRFAVLYSDKKSRPNTPVNQLVGALVLKHLYNWTYEELILALNFNYLTRHALGLRSMEEDIFCESTIFNFQRRLFEHYVNHGAHLIEEVFDHLTQDQLKSLGIRSNIQRCDSFQAGSNIYDYPRLQLCIEVLLRLYRSLSETDQQHYHSFFAPYLKQTAGQYTFRLSKTEIPGELQQIAQVYHELYQQLRPTYQGTTIFEIFARVYGEHFVVKEDQITLIPTKDLSSSTLLSPDDAEATYRKKRGEDHFGYVTHICETAHPENNINLLTDVATAPNNTDDGGILAQQANGMLEKTPELAELHTDGGYPSPEVDKILIPAEVTLFSTNQRGRKAQVEFEIEQQETTQDEKPAYAVSCQGGQKVEAGLTPKGNRWRAAFICRKCKGCPWEERCPLKSSVTKGVRWYYFEEKDVLRNMRKKMAKAVPKERHKLRANVEASVRQMKRGIKDGKLRVRGLKQAQTYAFFTAIGVNFKRIHQAKEREKLNRRLKRAS